MSFIRPAKAQTSLISAQCTQSSRDPKLRKQQSLGLNHKLFTSETSFHWYYFFYHIICVNVDTSFSQNLGFNLVSNAVSGSPGFPALQVQASLGSSLQTAFIGFAHRNFFPGGTAQVDIMPRAIKERQRKKIYTFWIHFGSTVYTVEL